MSVSVPADLFVLVADTDMREGLNGLFSRPQALGVRPFSFRIVVHAERDPGIVKNAHEFIRPLAKQYGHALVLFDHEGCGRESEAAVSVAADIQSHLDRSGWQDRSRVIAIDPELEIWVWSTSNEVDHALGWVREQPTLRDWLRQEGLLAPDAAKPSHPKDAVEAALRRVRKLRSSAIYHQLGEGVSVRRCVDPAFQRLLATLRTWFPPE